MTSFRSPAGGAGVFGVVLSEGVRLDRLEARKQQLPPLPSRLEKGDALYSQGLFAKALEEFDRVENTTELADVKSEARYKRALCLVELRRGAEAKPIFENLAASKGPLADPRHLPGLEDVVENRRARRQWTSNRRTRSSTS